MKKQKSSLQMELFPIALYTHDKSAAKETMPAPLATAKEFDFSLQHYAPTEKGQEYLYSIQDWIVGLTGDSPRSVNLSWAKLKIQLLISIQQLPYTASNGKTYQMDFTNAYGLYLISQNLRSTKDRPQLKKVREFLAKSAAWVELIARDKSAAKEAIKGIAGRHGIRIQGVEKRKAFTAVARDTHVTGKPRYDILTNVIYHKIGRTVSEKEAAREIAIALGLSDAQAKKMRDFFNPLLHSAITMAEEASNLAFKNYGRKLTTDEQINLVRQNARIVAVTAWDLANAAGIDLVTEQPLLNSGKKQ